MIRFLLNIGLKILIMKYFTKHLKWVWKDNVCLLINKEKSVGNSLEKVKQVEIRIQNILDFHCLLILSREKNIVGVDLESIEGALSTLDDGFKALNNAKSFDEINDVA